MAWMHGRERSAGARDCAVPGARAAPAGVTFGVLRKEKCTGDPARRLGNDLAISQVAEQNIETLRAAKVEKMVSICPHCVRTIGTDWREYGGTFEIEHHSELLARVQERLPARDADRQKAVFHDPCYLGRYRNIYEEPREVAGRTMDVIDPHRTRERSFCCGAGGGQMFLGEEEGKRVNLERVEELVATGAEVIGTACPFCQTMFRDALGEAAGRIGMRRRSCWILRRSRRRRCPRCKRRKRRNPAREGSPARSPRKTFFFVSYFWM